MTTLREIARCNAFQVATFAALAACSQSRTSSPPAPLTQRHVLHGIDFSPYIDGQDPHHGATVPPSQLAARLALVAPDATWIRTFSVSNGLEAAGAMIHALGKRAAIGAWIGPNQLDNVQEVTRAIQIAQAGDADMVIVGSEVLLRGDLPKADLIAHIQAVRSQVPPTVRVTTADVYSAFLANPDLVAAVDLIAANIYPYWEAIPVDAAVAVVARRYGGLQAIAQGRPVLISETGWPSAGSAQGSAVPSDVNAARYFLEFVSWAKQVNAEYFYFSGLDETWKAAYEGPQGAHWGIRDKYGALKPGMGAVFAGHTVAGNLPIDPLPGGPGFPTLEFSSVPPIGSTADLHGHVLQASPMLSGVAVHIQVNSTPWAMPYWHAPLTSVDCNGEWTCDMTTGGTDTRANRSAIFLLPNGIHPSLMSAGSSLPSCLYSGSVACIEVER